jgi:glyoxylase-like metal-dependent hydrolase (beta-lactamase superfamily II)
MADNKARVQEIVLEEWEGIYGDDMSEAEILKTDPNDFDMDPSMFYEVLQERLEVDYDEDNDYFGGYGGTVAKTIEFLAERWDGKTGA